MKPDFYRMTVKELRDYILANRTDTNAIHVMVEKIKAQPGQWYSPEDADRFPEIFAEHQRLKRKQANE